MLKFRLAMDAGRWEKIAQLYDLACEQPTAGRDAFVAEACQGDEELRHEVESLLRQDVSQDGPIERVTQQVRTALGCPATIGPYRIVTLIGEGGMGAVYEAQQDHPRRTVALKVLKSALAGPELQRRFSQEAEVLGRLEHPNIARVYEAGTAQTDFGPQPYFAMEFIRGVSLLEYANQHGLSTSQRITLVIKICEAVDYAHRHGIIHRDLKPGNILVDESGQPKILDFGVARVMDRDANVTRQTALGDLVGTLEYMSPEQLLADPLLVDAQSDVYSLGVVLYELLAGRRPYEVDRQWPEAARIIREQDPLPLSAVDRAYRGDLGTIVARALEKDKAHRYTSASALAADLGRFVAHEPILARPASAIYRTQKFVRRHRGLVSATGIVFIVLLAGIIVSMGQAIRARRERDRALRAEQIAKAVNDFLQDDLLAQAGARAQADAHSKPDPDLKVRTALDRAAARIPGRFDSQPAVEAAIRRTMGLAYLEMALFPEAQVELERAVELRKRVLGPEHPDTLTSMDELGGLYTYQGKYTAAESLLTQVLETRRRVLGKVHKDTLRSMSSLGLVVTYEGDFARATPLLAEAVEGERRVLGEEDPTTLSAMDALGANYLRLGQFAQSAALHEKELEIKRRILGPDHPNTVNGMHNLAVVYRALGKYQQADALFEAVLEARRRALGEDHWETQNTRLSLGISYRAQGRYGEAEPLLLLAYRNTARLLGSEHNLTLQTLYHLGELYRQQRRFGEADAFFERALGVYRRVLGPDNPFTAQALASLGEMKLDQHSYVDAERLLREALQIRVQKTPDAWERYWNQSMLGATLRGERRYDEAWPLLDAGYQGMLDRQSTIPAEYQSNLQQAHAWLQR